MDCIKKEFVRTDADGHKWWRVVLTATEAPDSLQLTGADVDGMDDNIRFESGSVLLTPSSNYIAFEDGVFTQKGGGVTPTPSDPIVSINNITGDQVEIYVAESIEALVGGTSETVLIADGESTQTFTAGSVFAFAPDSPLDVSSNSGDITLKDYMGVPYWEVGGNGSIVISSTI